MKIRMTAEARLIDGGAAARIVCRDGTVIHCQGLGDARRTMERVSWLADTLSIRLRFRALPEITSTLSRRGA